MRWETVAATANNELYHLWHKDKILLTLTIHPFSNSARVECDDEKRVFLIRKEGFRRNKIVLRNEYGIKLGELGMDEKASFIDVNNERFFYEIQKEPLAKLILYKESADNPFVECGLTTIAGDSSISFSKNKKLTSHPGLLMALCWYMFLPVAKGNATEFAM